MNTLSVSAKKDFLERLASGPPMKALSELIWNGLDAGSDRVEVELEQNALSGLEVIRVKDYGCGINRSEIDALFGSLGDSWKKSKRRYKGRSLHGKNGAGRFKAFALGNRVEWDTTYDSNGQNERYQIVGRVDALGNPTFTDPAPANGSPTGTQVIITGIEGTLTPLISDSAIEELAKHFAPYLSKCPEVEILYNGTRVDPTTIQSVTKDLPLTDIDVGNGRKVDAEVTVIEWTSPTKRVIHLCDSAGVSLHETEAGTQVRAPGFHFTAYIKTDRFRDLDQEGLLVMEDLSPEVAAIVKAAKQALRGYFRKRLAQLHVPTVERWRAENIYPFDERENLNAVEEAERQVFDIVAANVEAYLPDFDDTNLKSKQFVFRLLAQAVQQNPESLETIITEVLNLKPHDRDDLAELLRKTSFPAIITTAKTVANRLDFLVALENLLFDKESKQKLLERDQLHRILETEAWIFDEGFALSGSEKRLEEVLELHLHTLGARADAADVAQGPVLREEHKQGRVDLMLSRVTSPRHDERDHLVVELKRPSQRINSTIISQVESYAIAVAQDPRFLAEKTRWRFIVIGNEMDEHARRKARQRQRPAGLTFDDSDLNIEVWAFEWTEVITDAKSRLQFINASLNYEATRDSATGYLARTHSKFIPELDSDDVMEEERE